VMHAACIQKRAESEGLLCGVLCAVCCVCCVQINDPNDPTRKLDDYWTPSQVRVCALLPSLRTPVEPASQPLCMSLPDPTRLWLARLADPAISCNSETPNSKIAGVAAPTNTGAAG
jgi:hypothetical protein